MGILKTAGFYDEVFSTSDTFKVHYSKSCYLDIWEKAMGHIKIKEEQILELGCGTGQFAEMLFDNGFHNYTGIDFSKIGIKMAKERNAKYEFKFIPTDINKYLKVYQGYNTIIALEVMEHLEDDLAVLKLIRSMAQIILSLPVNDQPSHVRIFKTRKDVTTRYSGLIGFEGIQKIGDYFVVNGVKI